MSIGGGSSALGGSTSDSSGSSMLFSSAKAKSAKWPKPTPKGEDTVGVGPWEPGDPRYVDYLAWQKANPDNPQSWNWWVDNIFRPGTGTGTGGGTTPPPTPPAPIIPEGPLAGLPTAYQTPATLAVPPDWLSKLPGMQGALAPFYTYPQGEVPLFNNLNLGLNAYGGSVPNLTSLLGQAIGRK